MIAIVRMCVVLQERMTSHVTACSATLTSSCVSCGTMTSMVMLLTDKRLSLGHRDLNLMTVARAAAVQVSQRVFTIICQLNRIDSPTGRMDCKSKTPVCVHLYR